jgi:hypothetical protein
VRVQGIDTTGLRFKTESSHHEVICANFSAGISYIVPLRVLIVHINYLLGFDLM